MVAAYGLLLSVEKARAQMNDRVAPARQLAFQVGIHVQVGIVRTQDISLDVRAHDPHKGRVVEIDVGYGVNQNLIGLFINGVTLVEIGNLTPLINQRVKSRITITREIEDLIGTVLEIVIVLDVGETVLAADIAIVAIVSFQFEPFGPFRRIDGCTNANSA